MAPILAAANEERLDAHLARLAGQRENIAIAKALGMDGLRALHVSQCTQAVAVHCRQFEILTLGGQRHFLAEPGLDTSRLARKECLRILDQDSIILLVDPSDAWGRTATDLVQ